MAGALGAWLAPAFAGGANGGSSPRLRGGQPTLRLSYDADQVDALSADREALWARIGAAEFLTVNEKRVASVARRVRQHTCPVNTQVAACAGMSGENAAPA